MNTRNSADTKILAAGSQRMKLLSLGRCNEYKEISWVRISKKFCLERLKRSFSTVDGCGSSRLPCLVHDISASVMLLQL